VYVSQTQTRTPAVHLRLKQSESEVKGTAAHQHTALDWRWEIRSFLLFRLNELGLDGEMSVTRKRHLRQPTSRQQSPACSGSPGLPARAQSLPAPNRPFHQVKSRFIPQMTHKPNTQNRAQLMCLSCEPALKVRLVASNKRDENEWEGYSAA